MVIFPKSRIGTIRGCARFEEKYYFDSNKIKYTNIFVNGEAQFFNFLRQW